jgi:hypothetical protein
MGKNDVDVEDLEAEDEVEMESVEEGANRLLNELEYEEVDDTELDDEDDGQPNTESLQSEVAELRAQLANAQSTAEIKSGFEQLGSVLKDLASQKTGDADTDKKNQQALVDYKAKKKELEDKYYDAPLDAVESLYQLKLQQEIAPAFQQLLGEIQSLKASVGEQKAKDDDIGRMVIEDYGDEVTQLVSNGRVNYQDAVQQVAGKHMTELIKKATEQALSTQTTETKKVGKNQNVSSRPAPSTPSDKKVRISKSDMATIRREAQMRALNLNDYVSWLKRHNDPRVSGKRR